MKAKTIKDVHGRNITALLPESEADLASLREQEESGEVDMDDSFADRPTSLPLEETESERGVKG